tara:strand:- start:1441 stop:1947 length:507 start_codon:yes stop_codon:yes gene_type:complete
MKEKEDRDFMSDLNHQPSYNDDMYLAKEDNLEEWKSTTISKIAKALSKSQSELRGVQKNSDNPYFKSKYADLYALIEASFPVLTKNGLSVIQGSRFCTLSNGFYITTTLLHESGEWLKSELRLPIVKKDAQAVGSAVTYGRRYGLAAMCGLAQHDDDGNTASGKTSLT